MYVCLCKAITEKQITRELEKGARSLSDLQNRLELGTQCGSCRAQAQCMVTEHQSKQSQKNESATQNTLFPINIFIPSPR